MANLNSILRLKSHENRTPTGRVSTTATRKLANYLAYGRGRPAQQVQRGVRGVWLDQTGKEVAHEQVLAWIKAEGRQQHFTHQLLLSVSEMTLTPEDYHQALVDAGQYLPTWRLITHTDTAYSHAHVLAFGPEEIDVKEPHFREWWLQVRRELDAQQQAYLDRLAVEPNRELDSGLQLDLVQAQQSGLSIEPLQRSGQQAEQSSDLSAQLDLEEEVGL